MTINQITYGNATHELVFDNKDWNWENISAVDLMITDHSATELLDSAASCTLWDGVIKTGTTPAITDSTISVTDAADANPRQGARYRIVSADTGIIEDVICDTWDKDGSTQFVLTLEEDLTMAHAAADDVYGCYAVVEVDFSDTDVFTKGRELRLVWTPTGSDDAPVVEAVVVGSTEFAIPDISDADGTEAPSDDVIAADFKAVMETAGIAVDRGQNPAMLERGLRLFARKEKLAYHGDDAKHELEVAREMYQEWFVSATQRSEIWQDHDQDGIKDDGEDAPTGWSWTERSI